MRIKLISALIALQFFSASPLMAQSNTVSKLALGKYGCTSSHYNFQTKYHEFTPHGSIVLSSNGAYSYLAFEKPSVGAYKIDLTSGKVFFSGGYLNNGEATPIEGQSNRFYLVFPAIMATNAHRWTCGLK